VFQEAPIGMALLDEDERLLMVNQAFCNMLGYSERELTSLTLEAITDLEDVSTSAGLTARVLEGTLAGFPVERRYIKKNRETLWAELTVAVIGNGDGTTYRLAMIQDIFERKRAELLEDEQRHVAYELHDGLVQVAAGAHLHLQAFAGHYRPHSAQARLELDRALELAQRAAYEARCVIAGLRPTVVEELGLASALRMQVESLRTEGWAITYEEALGQERLPPTVETTLFRVALEALSNVRKHAQTIRARLAIENTGPIVRLEAQDWGRGFQPSELAGAGSTGHFGLHEMRERIALLGGRFAIHSQPGAGTRVVVEIPLPMSDTPPSPVVPTHDKANGERGASNDQ
jgi:PAS domain S-box-containing protein